MLCCAAELEAVGWIEEEDGRQGGDGARLDGVQQGRVEVSNPSFGHGIRAVKKAVPVR